MNNFNLIPNLAVEEASGCWTCGGCQGCDGCKGCRGTTAVAIEQDIDQLA